MVARPRSSAPAIHSVVRAFGQTKTTFGGAAHDAHGHDAHGHDDHGHGHGHSEPHAPEGYAKLGKACLIACYLWIFYRAQQDKGQLFGFYLPWLHEHEHEHEPVFQEAGDLGDTMPTVVEEEEEEDDEEDDE